MLHPDFPVISGEYQMTKEWRVNLPGDFNRRVEDGDLVIWRPGFTMWISAWGNDDNKTQQQRLSWIKEDISENAFDLIELNENNLLKISYRLNEESDDERVAAYYCFAVSNSGYVQMAIYFDSKDDLDIAESIWRSIIAIDPK